MEKDKDICIKFNKTGIGRSIIMLHGWGSNKEVFNGIINKLKYKYTIYNLDLPGFGESKIDRSVYLDENVKLLHEFIITNNIINPIILGHSYGCRIAVIYASIYPVFALILVSSPGVKEKLCIKKKLKIKAFKAFKKVGIELNVGSSDYKNTNPITRSMLVEAVNRDLSDNMRKSKCLTLLIYGDKDKVTNVQLARKVNEKIENSTLVIIQDAEHYPFLNKPIKVCNIIESFIDGISGINTQCG